MLDGELFDKLEAISRSVRKNNDPFGNILLVLSGDFLQLPPVPSNGGNYKFCFEAASWNRCINVKLQLSTVFRQQESVFIEMLNEIRVGFVSQKTTDIMNKLINPPKYPDDGILVTEFYHLEKLKTKKYTYYSIDYDPPRYGQIQKLVHNCLALHELELKRGSQVMLIKNIRKDLVNGSRGVIVGFYLKTTKKKYYNGEDEHIEFDQEDLLPIVKFTKNREETIGVAEWNLIETIETDDIPLLPAWAITIHKSQAQTVERLKVDLNNVFASGHVYVALSRAMSLGSLQVLNFSKDKVVADPKAIMFYESLSQAKVLAELDIRKAVAEAEKAEIEARKIKILYSRIGY
ncbi:7489_t:CDS:2 [Entrophospora sp. SA101]|nr:7489_t:CDS:2 [Entrophospora sp. SA101]